MSGFFAGLVAFMKGINSLKEIGEFFVTEWMKYDISKIGGEAETRKEINEVLNLKLKQTSNDSERRALLLAIHGNRKLP